jgi:Cupin domain.
MMCNPFSLSGGRTMDRTPPPVSLAAALALPRTPGRSSEVFVDGDLEVRFAARPTNGPQVPHQRDELYFVASGSGHYRVEETVTAVGPGDVLFCAAHVAHGFEIFRRIFPCGCCFMASKSSGTRFQTDSLPLLLPPRVFFTRTGIPFARKRYCCGAP